MFHDYLKNLDRIEFTVTMACTGRCKHCPEGDHVNCTGHIDRDVAVDAVRKICSHFKIRSLMTFGGEPLLYPEVVYAIHETARNMGIADRQLITNGYFSKSKEKIAEVVEKLRRFPHLLWKGISTHPGHVYGAASASEVPGYCAEEAEQIGAAVRNLKAAGLVPEIVGSGSTPTYAANIGDPVINMYHPGNYVFNDAIQISNGTAEEGNCALTVLATVISNPSEGHFICDAGAKCLGLDQGAHGNSSLTGHGRVIGHPELKVSHLSEEVGQIEAAGPTDLKIGDRIRIIPNHSCSTANLTSRMTGIRKGQTDRVILVNMRGNQ